MVLAMDHCRNGDRQTGRHHCHQCLLFSVLHKHTYTHTHRVLSLLSVLAHAACVPSVQDTELKGHSLLLLSPAKCHQATPAPSSLSVSHVKSLWTISYSLAAEVREIIKHPTGRGEHALDNAPVYVMSYFAPCEGIKSTVTEPFYYQALFTEVGAWIWHKKLSCLSPLFFCLCSKQCTFLGWRRMKTGNEWGACGELCQNVLMISLAWLILNTSRQECGYLLRAFGLVCGKETGLSVGNGLLLIQSWRSTVCYRLWWKSSAWFKEDKCRKKVFVQRSDPVSPPWAQLMSRAFEDAW